MKKKQFPETTDRSARNATTKQAFVYMLECGDGSLYTGWTTDLEDRVKTHNSGQGAKYTRSRLPVKLVYFEEVDSRSTALKREAAIKKLTRLQKEKLVNGQLLQLAENTIK